MHLTEANYHVSVELIAAMNDWPPMHSAHEGYAILLEELGELWTEVQAHQKTGNPEWMRREAVQVAAMAIRFLVDLCPTAHPPLKDPAPDTAINLWWNKSEPKG